MTLLVERQEIAHGGVTTLLRRRAGKAAPADVMDMREEVHGVNDVADIDRVVKRERDEFLRRVDAMLARSAQTDIVAGVPANAYIVNTGASAVALAAATARTIVYINAGSTNAPSMTEFCVSFDGVTSSAVPVLVEELMGTAASNSTPGTNSTTFTPVQIRGGGLGSSASTTAAAHSALAANDPTVTTVLRQWLVRPDGGLLLVQFPLGREPTGIVTATTYGKQQSLRCTAPAIVNVRGYLEFEE